MPRRDVDKVPVTMRALLQRINRKLAKKDEQLMMSRGAYRADVGGHFIVHHELGKGRGNWRSRALVRTHVDPVKLGRDLGVLAPWERVVE